MSTIAAVQIYRADLPLGRRLEHASASKAVLEEVFLRIRTRDGVWGLAEIRGNGAYATGTDTGELLAELERGLVPALPGLSLCDASSRLPELTAVPLARALADSAILDARARQAGVPVCRLLGGDPATLPTHAQIGFCEPRDAARLSRDFVAAGFGRIKVRVGRSDPGRDLEVVRAVREAAGFGTAIAIDANGGWDAATAIDILSKLSPRGIAWVEQPTPATDIDGLREVASASDIPVLGDESVRTPRDLEELIEARAVNGVHLKLEKAGTADRLIAMARRARQAGLFVCIGQMDQGRLGSSMTAHLAAAIGAEACELWGFQNVVRDVATGLDLAGGAVCLTGALGTGVTVRPDDLTVVAKFE